MMNKAVFFDRDGTLNNNSDYYVFSEERLVLNPGVETTLAELTRRGYLLFVVSNQSGIARGLYTREDADKVNAKLCDVLKKAGAEITAVSYCSHHPEFGKCLCRKPQPLLIQRLLARYRVDPALSFMVGDALRDVEAGEAAGLKGILIDANSDLTNVLNSIPS